MITKSIACAAVIAIYASSAFAGGLAPEIVEAPVIPEEPVIASSGSVNPSYVVLGVLAALLIASSIDGDDEGDDNGGTDGGTDCGKLCVE